MLFGDGALGQFDLGEPDTSPTPEVAVPIVARAVFCWTDSACAKFCWISGSQSCWEIS